MLLDLEYALARDEDGRSVRVPEWVQARAEEWIDGIGFDRTIDPAKLSLTAWEPQLVESIPDLQQAIRDAHDSDAHLVKWDGQWTTIDALYRMLDDTRTVRRISGAMSRKRHQEPILTGIGAAQGFCSVCGARRDEGTVWRDLARDTFWCEAHGSRQALPIVIASS